MIRTYTYKLYSNNKWEQKYEKHLSVCRYVYNLAKETKECAYQNGLKLSGFDLAKQLTDCKKEEGFEWLKQVNSQSLQAVIERLELGYKRFFSDLKKGVKTNKPKWAKKDKFQTITYKQNIKETEKGFKLPSFGEIKVFNKKKIDGKIKQARITKKAGNLYVQVLVEKEDTYNINKNQVGLDMGISYFLTTSEGEFIGNPKHLNRYLGQLRVENRSLARKKKGSNNFWKQVKVLQRLHFKVSETRKDFLHKISTRLAAENGTIFREDLKVKEMVKNRNLSKAIQDVSWGKFFELLEYKTTAIKVNPAYTSQTCNSCGFVSKENRKTQSEFKCLKCGEAGNADINAAKNIKKLGHQLLLAKVNH